MLERDKEQGSLIPDFFLQLLDRRYADVLDLKLPTEELIVGSKNRLKLSEAVNRGIAQLREYRNYFEDESNRKKVEQEYGLTAYRPTVALVIGRTPTFLDEEKYRQILETAPGYTNIITYDELFAQMKRIADIYGI